MADAQGNRYGPYDIEVAGSEAEAFTEEAVHDFFSFVSGVVSGGDLTFAGLTATISPIDVRVHGTYLVREDPWSVASPPTAASAPRRDILVARRQPTSGEGEAAVPGKTFLTLLQGTPAATPDDPPFDPDDDEPLWSWQVPGNGGTVITGQRDLRRSLDPAGNPTPKFLTAGAVGTGATAQPSAGDTLLGTSSIPPHRPGTLRFQIRYTWTAPGPALVIGKLQYPAGTDVPGSSTQLHNRGSTAPQSMISEGYMPSDGTARTLGLYLSSGMGGNTVSLDTMNTAVWLI